MRRMPLCVVFGANANPFASRGDTNRPAQMVRRGAGAGFESLFIVMPSIAYKRIVFVYRYAHALTEDEGGTGDNQKIKAPMHHASELFL